MASNIETLVQKFTEALSTWTSGSDEDLARHLVTSLGLDRLEEQEEQEQSLPLIVQIMQANYLAMAETMQRQADAAKAEANGARRIMEALVDAISAQQKKFTAIGIQIGAPEVAAVLAVAAGEVARRTRDDT